MTSTTLDVQSLYRTRKGAVDFVDVPELGYVVVDGRGAPEGGAFAAAIQALYSVSYGAHFLLKKECGDAPRVMPLEALWDLPPEDLISGRAEHDGDWDWRAMIVQPDPIDADIVARATEQARAKDLPALDQLRYVRWAEGRCAQILHVGPYSAEAPTIARLHQAVEAAGCRLRGRHHEIYLGDPRRCAPDRLRTLIRHPVTDQA